MDHSALQLFAPLIGLAYVFRLPHAGTGFGW
uniref:Uncharacterized protein n=1 Tax=Ralstonia syzygii R24 TaxID=907261 RepID=G3A5I1_9RALS|nr:hypothetical protein RALSY_30986 [Ralstonia syzygii R24]